VQTQVTTQLPVLATDRWNARQLSGGLTTGDKAGFGLCNRTVLFRERPKPRRLDGERGKLTWPRKSGLVA